MDNYILMNDMVQAHEARMMHLKRYYPFFRLMDTGLSSTGTEVTDAWICHILSLPSCVFLLRRIIFRISRYAMRITGNSWPDFW